MGTGASCSERPSTASDERLRTMLILRTYNCRTEDCTMREYLEAFAIDGMLTKDRLKEALRLSERPRTAAGLLDRLLLGADCFVDRSALGKPPDDGSVATAACRSQVIPVSSLIAFMEGDIASPLKRSTGEEGETPAKVNGPVTPAPKWTLPTSVVEQDKLERQNEAPTDSIPAISEGLDVDMSPRIVPVIERWKTQEEFCGGDASRLEGHVVPSLPDGKVHGAVGRQDTVANVQIGAESCGQEQCTALTRHRGTTLALQGRHAYRRPGQSRPVWRKRETVVQERVVQYTTLDEEGMVQQLFEMEKSQTEVLHMECKRSGEFAHRETTHYESGETFNGEIVLEEAGVEQYVHLRSADDEYEHLESSLPHRARQGAAAPGGTGDMGDADSVAPDISYACGAGSRDVENSPSEARRRNFGEGGAREPASPATPSSGGGRAGSDECHARFQGCYDGTQGEGARGARRAGGSFPSSSSPTSPYHYRSPSCSPRLSPRLSPPRSARSPYRQEGVGQKEDPYRGDCGQGPGVPESKFTGSREESGCPSAERCTPGGDPRPGRGPSRSDGHYFAGMFGDPGAVLCTSPRADVEQRCSTATVAAVAGEDTPVGARFQSSSSPHPGTFGFGCSSQDRREEGLDQSGDIDNLNSPPRLTTGCQLSPDPGAMPDNPDGEDNRGARVHSPVGAGRGRTAVAFTFGDRGRNGYTGKSEGLEAGCRPGFVGLFRDRGVQFGEEETPPLFLGATSTTRDEFSPDFVVLGDRGVDRDSLANGEARRGDEGGNAEQASRLIQELPSNTATVGGTTAWTPEEDLSDANGPLGLQSSGSLSPWSPPRSTRPTEASGIGGRGDPTPASPSKR